MNDEKHEKNYSYISKITVRIRDLTIDSDALCALRVAESTSEI